MTALAEICDRIPGNPVKGSRQMKGACQIEERKAIACFRSQQKTNPGSIQMVLPLAGLAR